MAYGSFVIQRDLTFTVNRGDIFIIMGGSGCGKSTLLRHLIGLKPPAKGRCSTTGIEFLGGRAARSGTASCARIGVLYQSGALWSSMTLAENVALPLREYTDLSPAQIRELVALKLALVGLAGFEDYYPSEISGGMQKRAGLARAMALDPEILFFDEPSAGLDPISSRRLDDLILELRDSLGATIVVVTHELASIFAIGNNSVFLDAGHQDHDRRRRPESAAGRHVQPEGANLFDPRRGLNPPHPNPPPQGEGRERVTRHIRQYLSKVLISEATRMAKPVSKTLIGAFVLGALALTFSGIVFLGSGALFRDIQEVVMFFDGSVGGLQVGAPVTFRGVAIGEVSKIQIVYEAAKQEFRIPVAAELYPDRIQRTGPHPIEDIVQG